MSLLSTADCQTAWANLRAPPLQFGRRPPQSNYPPDSVPEPDYGSRLESRQTKGGISPLAPPPPKGRVQSLPPILRIVCPNPLSSCSQGARDRWKALTPSFRGR